MSIRAPRISLLCAGLLAAALSGAAAADDSRFAELFADHAVLQREQPIPVWGYAAPADTVTVTLGDKTVEATADNAGHWQAHLPALPAGGPYDLSVSDHGAVRQTYHDILIGDVWLCSGQSNMEFTTGAATNAWNEINNSPNPNIRFANIARNTASSELSNLKTAVAWKPVSPQTTGESSAACYYMSKALQSSLNVPIGFINSSWGGTIIQAWISESRLRRLKSFDAALDILDLSAQDPDAAKTQWDALTAHWAASQAGLPPDDIVQAPPGAPWSPYTAMSTLFNAMIEPLSQYGIKGVAWYQGESNTYASREYQRLLSAMIDDWRTHFNRPELPFLIVQLPNYGAVATQPGNSNWADLREAERQVTLTTPDTALAVTIDLGDRFDIHPTEKSIVGQRLAAAARKAAYHQDVALSPAPQSVRRQGKDIIVTVSNSGAGLKTYSSNEAIAFEACDHNHACHYVTATVDKDRILLKGANQPDVKFIRYGWADAPLVNLFSASDLPLVPFEQTVP